MCGNTTLAWSLPIHQHVRQPRLYYTLLEKSIVVGGEQFFWGSDLGDALYLFIYIIM